MAKFVHSVLSAVARPFGLTVMSDKEASLYYLHDYKGAYAEYRDAQIEHNKRKLDLVWADPVTLDRVIAHIRGRGACTRGICHGARNGWEVGYLREQTGADVIGTDISDTATQFPHMVTWDFHEDNPEWTGRMDFVYSNSLDQAMDPRKAVAAWVRQLAPAGRVYVEHTMRHSPKGASSMDPFGAHPLIMPYLFFEWGRGAYRLEDLIEVDAKENNGLRAWVFVLAAEAA